MREGEKRGLDSEEEDRAPLTCAAAAIRKEGVREDVDGQGSGVDALSCDRGVGPSFLWR